MRVGTVMTCSYIWRNVGYMSCVDVCIGGDGWLCMGIYSVILGADR